MSTKNALYGYSVHTAAYKSTTRVCRPFILLACLIIELNW